MIIQCEQCQTRFRLDDSKVTVKGVKVRCAKCKHVFTVRKEEPEPEAVCFGAPLEQTALADQQTDAVNSSVSETQESAPSFSFGTESLEEKADNIVTMESVPFVASQPDITTSTVDEGPFSFSSQQEDQRFAVEHDKKTFSQEDVSFGDFDFGDSEAEFDGTSVVVPPSADFADNLKIQTPANGDSVKHEKPQGLDFSDDDMFGEVVQPAAEEQIDSISFDFGTDSFADSMDMGGSDSGQKNVAGTQDSVGDTPFSLGEIDFGDELTAVAVQQVNPDELKPSQEMLFSPLAEAQKKQEKPAEDDDLKKSFLVDSATDQEELPPLSITSRRKQSSFFTGLIAAVALLVIGVLGYFGFSTFMSDKGAVAPEAGKISVRAIKSTYVQNAAIGTLLVISGEALNEFSKSRAALQVKGTMFDAAGKVLATKTAYCGNPLTNEQLGNLPLDKIEAAMSNQFGDSLANLDVAAGKAVPFTIVIANPAKEAKDFAVESAGSTVATGKQQ